MAPHRDAPLPGSPSPHPLPAAFARQLVASLRSGLVGIDDTGRVVALSEEGARILGLGPPDEALGGDVARVLADQPEVALLLHGTLDGRERPSRAELRLESADGKTERTIGYTLLAVRGGGGEVVGAAMLFRDLTPYERMDEQARLRDRLQALGQMAAGLAHEIRNPLASLEVLCGLLKRRLGDRPDELGLVEELIGEVREVADTVAASLEFVRPAVVQREAVQLPEVVADALAQARARCPFDGLVECSFPPGFGPVSADPARLRSLLAELVVNALNAMRLVPRPEGHVLRLSARDCDGGVEIDVADSGPGVDLEDAERIFHPFFTTREHGSGIGLAEAQKVATAHGGTVTVSRAPEGGACFRLYLPHLDDESTAPADDRT